MIRYVTFGYLISMMSSCNVITCHKVGYNYDVNGEATTKLDLYFLKFLVADSWLLLVSMSSLS